MTKYTKEQLTQDFIERARKVHGDKFDYSKVDYTCKDSIVTIICPEHGEFRMMAHTHVRSPHGCQKCAEEARRKKRSLGKEDFIKKAREIHGDKYDYSKVEYVNNSTNVVIICPEHGEFLQAPSNHLRGKGCPLCGNKKRSQSNTKTTESFIESAIKKHGYRYDYSKVHYVNEKTPIIVGCPVHGDITILPSAHLNTTGCPQCGKIQQIKNKHLTTEEFIERAKAKYGDLYDYSKVNYVRHDIPIIVTCPEHGDFEIIPDSHLQGQKCPRCIKKNPISESNIIEFVQSVTHSEVVPHQRGLLNGKQEIDCYIPDKKIGIEYNGLIWHSDKFKKNLKYHLDKTNKCFEQGINLIHIFEDEYLNKEHLVKSKLETILGYYENKILLLSAQCTIQKIEVNVAKNFFDEYALNKPANAGLYVGAYYKNELVYVISFSETKTGWHIKDMVDNIKYRVPNIKKYIIEYFIENHHPEKIIVLVDRRWNCLGDSVLEEIGFKIEKIIRPSSWFVYGQARITNNGFKQLNLNKKLPKIWDAGWIEYIYKNKE